MLAEHWNGGQFHHNDKHNVRNRNRRKKLHNFSYIQLNYRFMFNYYVNVLRYNVPLYIEFLPLDTLFYLLFCLYYCLIHYQVVMVLLAYWLRGKDKTKIKSASYLLHCDVAEHHSCQLIFPENPLGTLNGNFFICPCFFFTGPCFWLSFCFLNCF